jgi:putative DNA primase/helicase
MSSSENYISAAINNESAIVANAVSSTRNHALNRSAFKLGTIPGITTDTAMNALLLAAGANGYLKEHGEKATRQVIDSGLKNGQRSPRAIPVRGQTAAPSVAPHRKPEAAGRITEAATTGKLPASNALPAWTPPDERGEPRFHKYGEDGPPAGLSDEIRRHIYKVDGQARRIKIKVKPKPGRGDWFNVYRVVGLDGVPGWQYAKPADYGLISYPPGIDPFDSESADDDLYWCEGEKDADTIVRLGALATTFGGTGDGLPAGCEAWFVDRNVIILADNDEGGRKHAEQKAALTHSIAKSVRIIHFPELPEKGDATDWIALGKSLEDLQHRVDATLPWMIPSRVVDSPGSAAAGLDVVCMADVKPTSIEWLWPNWIAIGKVSVLAGEGGRGKSTILCDLAARVTNCDKWPDAAAASRSAGGVIILAAEDDVGDTLAPRLLAAGADMARLFVIRSVHDENQKRRGFSLQADLERLEAEIRKRDNIRLIIIDPVSSYLGQVDSHKNSDVRAVLEPLGEMAARMRVAIICNNHFSKGGGSANNRVIGSVAFVNQARAAFIVTPDEEDETRMLLIPSKMNIAPLRHGLAYRIEGCLINFEGAEIATSRIMYESAPITISADQALAALDGNGENRSEKSEAIDFLNDALRGGPVSAKDMKKDAAEAGISPKSLRSAREALGIKPEKAGFEGGWVWRLPKMPSEVEDAREL